MTQIYFSDRSQQFWARHPKTNAMLWFDTERAARAYLDRIAAENAKPQTKNIHHNINCAVVRSGDLKAWCDCGAEAPIMQQIKVEVAERIAATAERTAIVAFMRREAADIIGKTLTGAVDPNDWERVALAVEILAGMIEENDHHGARRSHREHDAD